VANANRPHGFEPVLNGECSPLFRYLNKAVGEATALFRNDLVIQRAAGTIAACPGAVPALTKAIGVNTNYAAGALASVHGIIMDPFAVFEAQGDGALTEAANGSNADISAAVAGEVVTGLSGHQISVASLATTAALPIKLGELFQTFDNAHGANAMFTCTINRIQEVGV
jgi:hypothetical protein